MALTASFVGCVKEDMDDCDIPYSLTVRAYERGTNNELSTGDVSDLTLFVFDKELRFTHKIETALGQRVDLSAKRREDLHIVAWGNLTQGRQSYTDPQVGDHLDDCFVELDARTRAVSYVHSPGDLFRGDLTIAASDLEGDKTLPIHREVGSMEIILRDLKGFSGFNDEDFHVEVRETFSAIDFRGQYTGDAVAYLPGGVFRTNAGGRQEYYVEAFNLLSNETGVYIDIYHGSDLIATASMDGQSNPLVVEKDKLTHVLIDLKAGISVSVALTDWEGDYIWKEF